MPPRVAKAKTEPEPEGFEPMLQELQRTVAALESGALGLDDALAAYERGVGLLGRCKGLLDAAERKVAVLTGVDEAGQVQTSPFDGEAAAPAPATPTTPAPPPPPPPVADERPSGAVPRPPWED